MMVILAVMAISLTVAVQTATFQMKREKEEELIFRGNQIVEAIRIFRGRNGRFPVVLKELWEADPRLLRQTWKDPITGEVDWVPVFLGQEGGQIGAPGQGTGAVPTPTPDAWDFGDSGGDDEGFGGGEGGVGGGPDGSKFPATDAHGPIIGVHSRSCDEAIKLLDGRDRYCEWKFAMETKQSGKDQGTPPNPTPRR